MPRCPADSAAQLARADPGRSATIAASRRTAITDAVARALDYYSGRGPIRLFFERQGQISSTDFVIR